MEFCIGVLYKNMLSSCEFRENQLWQPYFTQGEMNFYPYFPYFLADLGEIRYGIPTHEAAEQPEFRKTRCSESHTLLKGVDEMLT
jgi:hypothetical protein